MRSPFITSKAPALTRTGPLRNVIVPATAAALTFALALSGCGPANEAPAAARNNNGGGNNSGSASMSGTLNGAGSSAQEAAMAAWQAGFQTANPDATVNYDAVGSGSGVEQFLAGGVDFAGSDAYLDDSQIKAAEKLCNGSIVEVPVYISPIAVIYNLPGVDKLNLSADTIAKIFTNKITTWDDAAIKAQNPDTTLPSTSITPVHRSDDSGTTANFTDYLSATADTAWTYGSVETWPLKRGEAADGTSGVVQSVTSGEGAIGYADASQAGDLGVANVKVGSEYVTLSAQTAAATADQSPAVKGRSKADLAINVDRTLSSGNVYPIVLVSYQIACGTYTDAAQGGLEKAFLSFVVSPAGQQAAAKAAGSAPLSSALSQQAKAAVGTIAGG